MVEQLQLKSNNVQWIAPEDAPYDGLELTDAEQSYLLPHFTMMLIGKPGSGKTQLLHQMLTNNTMYNGKFDKVFLISPSHAKMGLPIKADNVNAGFSLDWIFSKIETVNTEQQKKVGQRLGQSSSAQLRRGVDTQYVKPKGIPSNHPAASAYSQKNATLFGLKDGHLFSTQFQPATLRAQASSLAPAQSATSKKPLKAHELAQNEARDVKDQQKMYKDVKELSPTDQKETHVNVLFVFDDVVGTIKRSEYDPRLAQLFMNRRHLIFNGTISLIVVSQKYTLIPSRIRSTASWLIFFHLNPRDLELIYSDVVLLNKPAWLQLLAFAFGSIDKLK